MADEHAIGCETSESSRGEKAQHRVDAEALVATLPTQQPREVFRLGESA